MTTKKMVDPKAQNTTDDPKQDGTTEVNPAFQEGVKALQAVQDCMRKFRLSLRQLGELHAEMSKHPFMSVVNLLQREKEAADLAASKEEEEEDEETPGITPRVGKTYVLKGLVNEEYRCLRVNQKSRTAEFVIFDAEDDEDNDEGDYKTVPFSRIVEEV